MVQHQAEGIRYFFCTSSRRAGSSNYLPNWQALDVLHAEENHCFASSKEQKCCNTDSSPNEERVNKCTSRAPTTHKATRLGTVGPPRSPDSVPGAGLPRPFPSGPTGSAPSFWILPAVEKQLYPVELRVALQ